MDIDFTKPLTDEAKAYLKANLGKVEEAAGGVAIDPNEPLSRTAMEQLKIRHKIAGQEEDFSVWDGVQRASKAGGAEKAMKDAAEALTLKGALDRIKAANAIGQQPTDEDSALVLGALHPNPEALLGEDDGDQGTRGNGKGGKTAKAAADPDLEHKIAAAIDAGLKRIEKRLLPTEHHGAFLSEQLDAEAQKILRQAAEKSVKEDPRRKEIEKKIGTDANRKEIMAIYDRAAIDTVVQQATGRIQEIKASGGSGDILSEMKGLAEGVVAAMNPQAMLDRAVPQPILIGGGGPDDLPLTVPSAQDAPARPKLDDPEFADKTAALWAHRIASQQMAGSQT